MTNRLRFADLFLALAFLVAPAAAYAADAQQEAVYRQVGDIAAKPYPAVEGIERVMQVYDCHEMRRHKAEDFYDASFVTELDKSGAIGALHKK
jgi:hypothetical protein